MGKLDVWVYSSTILVCLILGAAAYHYDHRAKGGHNHGNPAAGFLKSIYSKKTASDASTNKPNDEDGRDAIKVKVVPSIPSGRDNALFIFSVVSSLVGVAGICFAGVNLYLIRIQTQEIHGQRVTMQETLEAIRRQAVTMEKQTEHLGDSVELAFKGLISNERTFRAMKSKERAKISMEIKDFAFSPHALLRYKLTCHGTTPAYVTKSWHQVTIIPVADSPWSLKDFGVGIYDLPAVIPTGPIEDNIFIHGAGGFANPRIDLEDNIKKGDEFLLVRFWITYKDVFDDPQEFFFSKIYGIEKRRVDFLPTLFKNTVPAMLRSFMSHSPSYAEWYESHWQKPQELEEQK